MSVFVSRGCAGAALLSAAIMLFGVTSASVAKDAGPLNAKCDSMVRESGAWTSCLQQMADPAASDDELFYAGYWLAKTEKYEEALSFLRRVKAPDDRVLTYIGYSVRKLGRVGQALTYYQAALKQNPSSAVTRSYLGEAYVTLGAYDKAKRQLTLVEDLCGQDCRAYLDLQAAIESGV